MLPVSRKVIILLSFNGAVFVGIMPFLRELGHHLNPRQSALTYEIPCDDLSRSISEDLDMVQHTIGIRTSANGVNMCRFESLPYIVETATDRVHRKRIAQGSLDTKLLSCGNASYAARKSSHLAYFSRIVNVTGRSPATLLEWKTDRNSSYVGNQLSYGQGRIRVNETEFFYVYTSLAFRECTNTTETGPEFVRHFPYFIVTVRKSNPSTGGDKYAKKLFENVYEVCSNGKHGTTTLRIGAYVLLDRGDEVYVQVSDFDRLVPESPGNTFGIFPMS